jgi:hypothetical protein
MSYRLLFCFLIMLELCCVLGWVWTSSYIESAPRVPAPSISRAIPFNNHGAIVYLTPFEDQIGPGCIEVAVIIALVGGWVGVRCNWNFRRNDLC